MLQRTLAPRFIADEMGKCPPKFQRTLAAATGDFIDGIQLLFDLGKTGMKAIDIDPDVTARIVLLFLPHLLAPAMIGPGTEFRVGLDSRSGHVADSKRINRQHDADMIVIVLVRAGVISGRKIITGFAGSYGFEDQVSHGQIRIGGNLPEIGDFIAGSPVGTVDAGPFAAAALDCADDQADTVAGSVEAGAAFAIGWVFGGNFFNGREEF